MSILETVTLYWNDFGTVYTAVLNYSAWKIITVLTPALATIGMSRSAYHYAKGHEIGDFNHGMFVLRLADRLLTLIGGQEETMFRVKTGYDDDRNIQYAPIPMGSSFIGVILDVIAFTALSLILFVIWPAVAFISMTVGPLHICRVHNLRKKAFIASLKGETAEA